MCALDDVVFDMTLFGVGAWIYVLVVAVIMSVVVFATARDDTPPGYYGVRSLVCVVCNS